MKNELKKTFKNKKILITGHTGFKGSWLTLSLKDMGANILGISDCIPTKPSNFIVSKVNRGINSKIFDISNFAKLKKTITQFQPDFIFHLAAQSLVSKSYKDPKNTWQTNVSGTINLLEVLRNVKKKTVIVIITSDKAYKNVEKKTGYKETDLLAGVDPYSASKSAAELAIYSYFKSFLIFKKNITLGIARAGNVIGGGDWSKDRLIPDCIRAWSRNKRVTIRNPNSTRPWQHVLEVVWGYIIFSAKLKLNKKLNGEALNFGPSHKKNFKVIEVLKKMRTLWSKVKFSQEKKVKFKESKLLKLNSKKAKKLLGWNTILNFDKTIFWTIDWYQNFFSKKSYIKDYSITQIRNYKKDIMKRIL